MIAWDGSYEAANAVRDAAGLLRLASSVEVVRVIEDEEKADADRGLYPSTRLMEYLSRLDVHADYSTIDEEGGKVSQTLVSHARRIGAGLLVAGGYSHSRITERLFGGVTRSLLKACPIALVISH
nr:universal stress protein [Sphingomicrobium nitratireducens]